MTRSRIFGLLLALVFGLIAGSARAFDWAGFVLVGEGTTRVKLVARSGFGLVEGSALALAAALVAVFVALGLRRRKGTGGL